MILGVVAIWIRRKLHESEQFIALKEAGGLSKSPLKDAVTIHKWQTLIVFAVVYVHSCSSFCESFENIECTLNVLHQNGCGGRGCTLATAFITAAHQPPIPSHITATATITITITITIIITASQVFVGVRFLPVPRMGPVRKVNLCQLHTETHTEREGEREREKRKDTLVGVPLTTPVTRKGRRIPISVLSLPQGCTRVLCILC